LNSAHARLLQVRRLVLIGRLEEAERLMRRLDPSPFTPGLRAAYELTRAGIAIRHVRATAAKAALARAKSAAQEGRIDALVAEIEAAACALRAPAARLILRGVEQPLALEEVERFLASDALIVDACRHIVRRGSAVISLLRMLAEAWPGDAARRALVVRAFRGKQADESHRARLRVEMGRLRRALRSVARIDATAKGYALTTTSKGVVLLEQPFDGDHAALLALLSDGESWTSSALGLALGASQRSVQRALDTLAKAGKVQPVGRGPARRWTAPPLPGITTALLLPIFASSD
jgi:hypothetical protein